MISIHRIATLTAKISNAEDSHWISLTFTEPNGETSTEMTLYFQTRSAGFTEERRFTRALAEAINSIPPMVLGNWGRDEESDPDLSPIRETEAPQDEVLAQVEELSEHEPRPESDNRLRSSFNVEGTITGSTKV